MTRTDCQKSELLYMAAHADAQRRLKRNQRQVLCLVCHRWKWPDRLCATAQTQPYVEPPRGGTKR